MSRKCIVCESSDRDKIEKMMVSGQSFRDIERQFRIDKSSLHRHKKNHLPSALIKAKKGKEIVKATNLVEEISRLKRKAENIAKKAEERGDYRTALAGIRELTRIVELLAKMQGEMKDQTVNIVLNSEWVELRTIILSTLDDYPEAKIKLAEVLSNDHQ